MTDVTGSDLWTENYSFSPSYNPFVKPLLDQLGAIVDGRPVQQADVLFVWLPDIVSGFHQLFAALKDAEPETGKQQLISNCCGVKFQKQQ